VAKLIISVQHLAQILNYQKGMSTIRCKLTQLIYPKHALIQHYAENAEVGDPPSRHTQLFNSNCVI